MWVGGFLVCFSIFEEEEKKRGKIEHNSYKGRNEMVTSADVQATRRVLCFKVLKIITKLNLSMTGFVRATEE